MEKKFETTPELSNGQDFLKKALEEQKKEKEISEVYSYDKSQGGEHYDDWEKGK